MEERRKQSEFDQRQRGGRKKPFMAEGKRDATRQHAAQLHPTKLQRVAAAKSLGSH